MATRVVRNPLVLPRNGPLCHVQRVEIRPKGAAAPPSAQQPAGVSFVEAAARADPAADNDGGQNPASAPAPAPPAGGSAPAPLDVSNAQGLLRHVAFYTGVDSALTQGQAVMGQLARPENLEFRPVMTHFFSSVDPRATYGLVGTPGGDTGEFLNALAVNERLSERQFYADDVNSVFQEFLKLMESRGKRFFYLQTDEASMRALAAAAQVADPLKPADFRERNRVVALAVRPEHVGDMHLRGILTDPAGYGVRKELVEWFLQSFLNIYFDPYNPMRQHLLYVVLQGPFQKSAALAKVWSPDECPGIAPLLVPNTGRSQVPIYHEAHAAFLRQDLARFFTFRNAILDTRKFYEALQALARQQAAKLTVYSDAQPTDVIFTSLWDRWPF
jgi:hypothetical protein